MRLEMERSWYKSWSVRKSNVTEESSRVVVVGTSEGEEEELMRRKRSRRSLLLLILLIWKQLIVTRKISMGMIYKIVIILGSS